MNNEDGSHIVKLIALFTSLVIVFGLSFLVNLVVHNFLVAFILVVFVLLGIYGFLILLK